MSEKVILDGDSSGAVRSIRQVEDRLSSLNKSMGGLKSAIAGLALGNFITQTLNLGERLNALSRSTGIAAENIRGFQQALGASGANSDQANDALSDLVKNIGEAANGSSELQKTFGSVGVSLQDLATLSEQDILQKVVSGLANTQDNAQRSSTAMKIFGEAVKTVDFSNVNNSLAAFTAGNQGLSSAAKASADAQATFNTAITNLQSSLLQALEPLNRFLAELDPKQIQSFISTVVDLGKIIALVAATFGLFKYVINPLKGISGELVAIAVEGWTVKDVFKQLSSSAGSLLTPIKGALENIADAFGLLKDSGLRGAGALERFGVVLGSILSIGARLLGWLGIAYTAFEALDFIVKKFSSTGDGLVAMFDRAGKAVADFFGIQYSTAKEKEALAAQQKKDDEDELKRIQNRANAAAQEGQVQKDRRKVQDAIGEAVKKQTAELEKSLDAYRAQGLESQKQIQRDIELIGLTEEQITVKQALFNLEDAKLKELARLNDLYAEKSRSTKEEDQKMLPVIKAAIASVTTEYQNQLAPVMALTQEKLKGLAADKQRLELEQQLNNLADFGSKSRIDAERQLRSIQDDIAKSTMTEIEKKYYDIQRAAEESAKSQIETENARRAGLKLGPMSSAEEKAYYDAAVANVQRLQDAEKKRADNNKLWSTGFKQAFNDYVEAAGDAANKAANLFKKATQGMEDAIVGFAKTGKFEWKGFIASLAEELLRSQIQQLMANLFTGQKSGGSVILGGLKSLLGFANGGVIPTNGPVVVGERGPEILTGAAGRTVIPNEQAFGGGSVTYNINAVDAMSFKQMIAADPTFLFAVTEQGRRRLPGARA